jgi:hypothetical protein
LMCDVGVFERSFIYSLRWLIRKIDKTARVQG